MDADLERERGHAAGQYQGPATAGELNLTPEAYHARKDLVGCSMAKDALPDPALFYAKHVACTILSSEPSPSMRIGTLTDILLLQPSEWGRIVTEPVADKRTKDGKLIWAAFEEQAEGKIIAKLDEFETAKRCAAAVLAHPQASALLEMESKKQHGIWWQADYFIACKSLADIRGEAIIVDLKTAADPSPEAFARACVNFRYANQCAWYIDGHLAVYATDADFYFLVVGNAPPHSIGIYTLDQEAIEAGRQANREALAMIAECRKNNDWRAPWSRGVTPLSLPQYGLRRTEFSTL
jgi:exodeoxyribonuclease VIII